MSLSAPVDPLRRQRREPWPDYEWRLYHSFHVGDRVTRRGHNPATGEIVRLVDPQMDRLPRRGAYAVVHWAGRHGRNQLKSWWEQSIALERLLPVLPVTSGAQAGEHTEENPQKDPTCDPLTQ